jgi:hypothetical protein
MPCAGFDQDAPHLPEARPAAFTAGRFVGTGAALAAPSPDHMRMPTRA